MEIKKIIAVLLLIAIFASSGLFNVVAYAKKSEYTEITLSMFGNISAQDTISGIYKDNVFYVALDTLNKIGIIENVERNVITTNSGLRRFTIDIKKQIMYEERAQDYKLAIPMCEYQRKIYISALHFLRYIGLNVQINPNRSHQFFVYAPYTIYDIFSDYESNRDIAHFDWYEVEDYEGEKSDETLIKSCFWAIINKDSNFLKLLLPNGVEGIMTECVEDALVAILMNEGQNVANDETKALLDNYQLATDLMSLGGDAADYLHFLFDAVSPLINNEMVGALADYSQSVGTIVGAVSDYYNAVGAIATNIYRAQQFSSITNSQKTLLQKTMLSNMETALKYVKDADDQRVYKNAINTVHLRATNAYENNKESSIDTFNSLLINFGGKFIYSKLPILKTWDIATTAVKTIGPTSDMLDIMTCVSIAVYSNVLGNMAFQVFEKKYKTLQDNQFYYQNPALQKELIEELHNCLLFVYKASLTARQYLILAEKTGEELPGNLGGELIKNEHYNQSLVVMLNNLQNYQQVLVGIKPIVTEDLTWMDGWKGEEVTEEESSDINTAPITSDERDIVLVLDNSGSMSGTPIQETRKASENFVKTVLQQDASIGVVAFESEANMLSNFSMDEAQLMSALGNLYASGGTNTLAGLTMAGEMLEQSNAKKKIIVLMSDGCPSNSQGELAECAKELRKKGIIIYTLGFFDQVGDDNKAAAQSIMETIADDGRHYEVENADNLVYFFGDIADQITGQQYIYIRIACPVEVTVEYEGEQLCSDTNALNTRTSFGTLTFEERADGERVKILRLKQGTEYDIRIEGTGEGRMNYTIGLMDENGEYSDMRKFYNVKVTDKTVINTVASESRNTVLEVDEDGDGKLDIQYKAGENSRGEIVKTNHTVWIIPAVILILIASITLVVLKKKNILIKKG